ncbi:MAG: hypothetical protein LV480_09600 [Methylacidiphilales bacterium]|nr:hypothetical protein [Candidatus Methylacidiphilales bacterium]
MRTTLDVDDDVLAAVKSLADARQTTAGKVLSELARQSLRPKNAPTKRNGFTLFPAKKDGVPVTMELVNRLRDEDE